MSDIVFINRADVKWNDSYESYFINSNVSGDTLSGASLILGSSEVLAGKSFSVTSAISILSLGLVEILASTIPTTSISENIELFIGVAEEISSGTIIGTVVDSFLTMGLAEGVSSTSSCQVIITSNLDLGVVELLGSSTSVVSNTASEMTMGAVELVTSNIHVNSTTTTPQLSSGRIEHLVGSTSIIESIVSGFIILGTEEVVFASFNIDSNVDAELTLGVEVPLFATVNLQSFGEALITIGISELLAVSSISISLATGLSIDLGQDEPLDSTTLINSITSAELILGQSEILSSSIDITNDVDSLLTLGVHVILGSIIPTTSIVEPELTIGHIEPLESTSSVVSSISSFLILGLTEPLSSAIHLQSFIRQGGEWSNLIIGHTELLTHTVNIISSIDLTTLDLGGGIEELSHTNIIPEDVIFRNTQDVHWYIPYNNYLAQSNTFVELTLGHVELLATSIAYASVSNIAELEIGIDEPLSATNDIETAASAFILMGTTEQLSASINTEVIQNSLLVIGQIELLSSTVLSISITDSDLLIGNSEIQTATALAQSNTYAVLLTGSDESLSGSLSFSSNVEGIFSFGIIEFLSSSSLNLSVVDVDLEIGITEPLESTDLIHTSSISVLTLGVAEILRVTSSVISTTSNSNLTLGIVESLNVNQLINSNASAILSTGFSEELSATILISSNILNDLTIGHTEILLSTATSISSAFSGLLLTGELEILASSTFSVSITESELSLGVLEPLTSTIEIESQTSGFIIKGAIESISSSIDVQSYIRKGGRYSELTLGIIEVLEYTKTIETTVLETDLILGSDESLSFTYYFMGSSEADALLTTGKIEILGSSSISQTVVATNLTIGHVEELSGLTISIVKVEPILTLGVSEELSSSIDIVSVVDADIIIGVLELLASTIATTSKVTLDMVLGLDEPLSTGAIVVSNVNTFLLLGRAEQLDASIHITTSILTDVYLGVGEQLSTPIDITSNVSLPNLEIGIVELLTGNPSLSVDITAVLGLGILEVVAATSITQSNLPGDLTLGVSEPLEVNNLIQSTVNADLELGAATPLSATTNIISYSISLLTVGKAELLASSNFSISITDATITLGIDEPLSHTSVIETSSDANITMGIDTPLSNSTTLSSLVGTGNLVVGASELLASTNFSISITDATISFGSDEPLSSSILVQSYTNDGPLIIGIDELLASANASVTRFPPAELDLGAPEPLTSTAIVQAYVADVLDLGIYEPLSSTISISHLVENTIDIVIGGPVPVDATIEIESKAYGSWLYVPGNLEELESTINIISNIQPNLITDNELLESTDNIITTAYGSALSIGVIEIVAGTNFAISVTGSELKLGVSSILDSRTNEIVSNIYNTELTLGRNEPLDGVIVVEIISNIYADLVIGVVELLSNSVFSISIIDADLLIGRVEILSATINSTSKTKAFLGIPGVLETLEVTDNVISNVSTTGLVIGNVEVNGSVSNIISFAIADLRLGDSTDLSGRVHIPSFIYTKQDLMFGVIEELSGETSTISNIIGSIDSPCILESTVIISSYVTVDTFIFGQDEDLSSSIDITTESDALMVTGDLTELSGHIQLAKSFALGYLTNPTIYLNSDKYSAWNKPTSYVRASFIDIDGIIEVDTNIGIVSIVGDVEITMGLPDELNGTATIESLINNAELFIGHTELVATTNFSISITDAYLTHPVIYVSSNINIQSNVLDTVVTGPEHLYGSSFIVSIVDGNIVDGRVELVSAHESIISNINVELTIGIIEELSSRINSITSISIPEIIYNVYLESDETSLWNKVISNVTDSYLRVLSGYYTSLCTVNTQGLPKVLTLGIVEELDTTILAESNVVAELTTGYATHLSSTILFRSNSNAVITRSDYIGSSHSETESWAVLTLGVAEHFESGSINIQSNISNDGLIIGAIDLYVDYNIISNVDSELDLQYAIKSTATIQSLVDVELSVGTVTSLEHSSVITTNVSNSELEMGALVSLTADLFVESHVDGFIYTGMEYGIRSDIHIQSLVNESELFIGDAASLFGQANAQSLIITPYMFRGRFESLSASNVVITSYAGLDIIIGVVELLTSIIATHSVTDAELTIGIETDLTATSIIESASSGHIIIGTTEILSSTGLITSYTGLSDELYISIAIDGTIVNTSYTPVADVVIGTQESISASIVIGSSANVEYIDGAIEPLFATVSLTTNAGCIIDVGLATALAGSAIFSINIYDIDCWGIVEVLTSSINIKTKSDTFLNLGVANQLASSVNIVQTTTSSDLIIGLVEVLSATTTPWVESNSDTLWLDIEHRASAISQSIIPDVSITMGHLDNSVSSSVVISTECTIDPMYFGEDEILSAKSFTKVNVAIELTLGVSNEYLESSIECSTVIGTATELESETIDRLNRRITADLQYWYDHFVVNNKSLNLHQIGFPSRDHVYEQSFIELLFNDEYDKTSYRYMYREILDKSSWPDAIRQRMMLDPETAHYYIADGDNPKEYNINLYNIQSHDIVMMDRLLVYRLEPENATLVGVDYDILDTSLAKMIYIYLELKLTGTYSKYDNSAIFTTRVNSLETCYETYLTQTVFEHVSNKGT
jgi:hypothetical protein